MNTEKYHRNQTIFRRIFLLLSYYSIYVCFLITFSIMNMYFLRQVSHIILAVNEAENEVKINLSVPKTHKPSFHGFILLSKKIWKDSLTVKRVPGSIVRKILQRMIRKLGDTIFYGQRDDGKFWGGSKQPSKGTLLNGKWQRGRSKLPKNDWQSFLIQTTGMPQTLP